MERRAMQQADLMIFSSDWAAHSALNRYDADPSRVHVVPFGANLDSPSDRTVADSIAARDLERCDLLFIGIDWERKRGEFALRILEELRAMDVDATLTMVGAPPPRGLSLPSGTRALGFLDKRDAEQVATLRSLLARAHFLLLPSLADCTPVAACEAFAFGVPVVAADVGGMTSIVNDGRNGVLLDPEAEPKAYAGKNRLRSGQPFGLHRDGARGPLRSHQHIQLENGGTAGPHSVRWGRRFF